MRDSLKFWTCFLWIMPRYLEVVGATNLYKKKNLLEAMNSPSYCESLCRECFVFLKEEKYTSLRVNLVSSNGFVSFLLKSCIASGKCWLRVLLSIAEPQKYFWDISWVWQQPSQLTTEKESESTKPMSIIFVL